MKINTDVVILGNKVALVPYRKEQVLRYHEWMKDKFLQEMTCSEPLSLDGEYEMQESWIRDTDKLTFIILDHRHPPVHCNALAMQERFVSHMCGDVNLFFCDKENDKNCEISIMIAEASCRRSGMGMEAVLLMIGFAIRNLDVTRVCCKIGDSNHASISMFTKIGFEICNHVEVFKETELEYYVGAANNLNAIDSIDTSTIIDIDSDNSSRRNPALQRIATHLAGRLRQLQAKNKHLTSVTASFPPKLPPR